MAHTHMTVVGNDNISTNHLYNVGNRTYNIVNVTNPGRGKGKQLTLESCVAFDALLNSKERYPAPRCHIDTRITAQNVVTDWICRKGVWANKGIMWMSGAPGVGKSAIVQTVCESLDTDDGSKSWLTKLASSDRFVDGSHFFGRGQGDREKASFFPATIAYQLSRSLASCEGTIKRTIKSRPGILSETFPSQFRQLLIGTATKRWSFQRPITIVIDALDECDNVDDQVELLTLILEAVTTTNLRFLIASRPEQHIHTFFQRKDVSQHTYHIRLDEESFNTSRDIEVFLRDEFARIRRMKPEFCLPLPDGEHWPGNIIIVQIRDDSDSQFIFPTLVIGFIDTPFYSPDQQLQTLLAAPPPRAFSKLDILYERILSRCPPGLHEESDEVLGYQRLVKQIFAVITTWSDPLCSSKIAEVLGKKVDVVQSIILGPMRTLFKFDPTKPDSPVMLCHKSLRDYLLDIERSHNFFISSADVDNLFSRILSRCPPTAGFYTREELRSVLVVIETWPMQLSLPRIAEVLDVDFHLVQSVAYGPAKSLFHVGTHGGLQFSTSSLEPFLHDRNRSGEFSIQGATLDAMLIHILSRPPPLIPSLSYNCDDLLDVLTALVVRGAVSKQEIKESLLDVSADLVDRVIGGPAKSLFTIGPEGNIQFSISSVKPFLQDVARSGAYFIQGSFGSDATFIRILSRQPPSHPSRSYCRDDLLDVLAALVIQKGGQTTFHEIESSLLHLKANLVERVILGPAWHLFDEDSEGNVQFSIPSFEAFLQNPGRSGEFFIQGSSDLDIIYNRILSRQPPSDPSQSYPRELLMGVLAVVVTQPDKPTVQQIASILDVAPSFVKGVISGPAKKLFRLDRTNHVDLSLPSFKGFLLDAGRVGEYFKPGDMPDIFLRQILDQQHPSSDGGQPCSQSALLGVLNWVMTLEGRVKVHQIASALEVAPSVVDGIVLGPTGALFNLDVTQNVSFSTPFVRAFFLDADRAGKFFVQNKSLDTVFTHILCSQPPFGSLRSHSREVLVGVFTWVMALGNQVTTNQIAYFLHVVPSAVRNIIFGPTELLFRRDKDGNVDFSTPTFRTFLLDADRAGDFFVPIDNSDTLFTQILSHQPSLDTYPHVLLMGVLTWVMALGDQAVTIDQIASLLDVTPTLVKGVISGPAKALFKRDKDGNIEFSTPTFKQFLLDANRAGDYFVPTDDQDTLFVQMLSRPPSSNNLDPYPCELLMGVLTLVMALGDQVTIDEVASLLDVTPTLVRGVISGPAKALFRLNKDGNVGFSTTAFKPFLLDANRGGDFFVPTDNPDILFAELLSFPSSSDNLDPYRHELLMGILTVVVALGDWVKVHQIASALSVTPYLVEDVVLGSMKAIFKLQAHQDVDFSIPPIKDFLVDRTRSGKFFIPSNSLDTLVLRILATYPSPRDVFLDVLRVLAVWSHRLTIPQIAFILDIDPADVEGVVSGPGQVLFYRWSGGNVQLPPRVLDFFHDVSRAGQFYIPPRSLNPNHRWICERITKIM